MGVAIIVIILFHFSFCFPFPVSDLLSFGYLGVDVFFFLSGFGLYFSMSKKGTRPSTFYKNRFRKLFPEFWLVLLLAFFIDGDFSAGSFSGLLWKIFTVGYWIQKPYMFWFISAIVGFYIVFPLYYKAVQRKGLPAAFWSIGIGLLLMAAYALVMIFCYGNENKGGILILSIARVPVFFVGSLSAYLLKNNRDFRLSASVKWLAVLVSILLTVALFYVRLHFPQYLRTCSLSFIPFIIVAPMICVLLSLAFEHHPQGISSWLSKVGMISLELYMLHVWFRTLFFYSFSQSFGRPLAALVIVVISLLASILLYQINKLLLQPLFAKLVK